MDYEKAFDSVHNRAIAKKNEYNMYTLYIEFLKYMHRSVTAHLKQRERENQDQEKSKTGGQHLTKYIHSSIGEHV